MKRQAWQALRLRLVISHSLEAGQLYSMLPAGRGSAPVAATEGPPQAGALTRPCQQGLGRAGGPEWGQADRRGKEKGKDAKPTPSPVLAHLLNQGLWVLHRNGHPVSQVHNHEAPPI